MDNIHHERASRGAVSNGSSSLDAMLGGSDADAFLDALERFVCDGLRARESVVVVATMARLFELERRLGRHEFQFPTMQARGQYTRMNAHEALWQFMVGGRADPSKFQAFVERLLQDATRGGRKVRVYSEMADVLRGQGRHEAATEVDQLWRAACERLNCTRHAVSQAASSGPAASEPLGRGRMQQA